jgi:hypothetical protein
MSVAKVQLLRFLNLSEDPSVQPPGDLRLWKALGQALPDPKFSSFRVLGVEWPDDLDPQRVPKIEFWDEILCVSGVSSLSLSNECETTCLQRRRLGAKATELEMLLEEALREIGLGDNIEVWEARHFDIQTHVEIQLLEETIQRILQLESRSGLVDPTREELRFLRPCDPWGWSRRNDHVDPSSEIALADLFARFREVSDFDGNFDLFRRSYMIREQYPRVGANTKREASFYDRLAAIQNRHESTKHSESEGLIPSGVISAIVGFHRHADPLGTSKELDRSLRNVTAFSDDDIGVLQWLRVSHHRTRLQPIIGLRRNYQKGVKAKDANLFAINPLQSMNSLQWRRLGALLEQHKDLVEGLPWIFSGRTSWLASLRGLLSFHQGWQISESALRQVFAWEAARTATQQWIVFPSLWSEERLRDIFRDYGFEGVALGSELADKDCLVVLNSEGKHVDQSWIDIVAQGDTLLEVDKPINLSWTAPDLKTPTYGFEKVSIFPDQYLLRLSNLGVRGALARSLQSERKSSSRAREVSLRVHGPMPISGMKWMGQNGRHFVDAVGDGGAPASSDPRAASMIAIEACFRQLIARGVAPDARVGVSFFLNKPHCSNFPEKDAQNFGAYALAADGLFESLQAVTNFELSEIVLDQASSDLRDYECEPVAHLRAQIEPNTQPLLPGFRMTGEAIYAVGPRPAFMDIGSRILQHVRVVSNHVTRLNWTQQLELYGLIHRCIKENIIIDIRPIFSGGIAETLLEMGLWSGIGIQLKPSLSTIELFSGAPGRFLVGVLPQEAKKFESIVKSEWLTAVGTTGGEKLFGLPLERYREERNGGV